jgi:hypothetical protein
MSTLRRPRVLLADDYLMVAEALTILLSRSSTRSVWSKTAAS